MAGLKIVVIDDGEIGRLGRAAVLTALGHEVVPLTWVDLAPEVDAGRIDPEGVDLVLASFWPNRASWDRYAAIGTLAGLTALDRSRTRIVAILQARAVDNPMLGIRLARAGVHRLVTEAEASTTEKLRRLVEDPDLGWAPTPSKTDLALLGVGPGADPDAVVAWVMDRVGSGPAGESYLKAFRPGCTQNACGLSRRQAHSLRVRIAALGRLSPSPARLGGGPVMDRSVPRWSEVIAIANLCRGWEPDDDEQRGERPGFPDGGWWEAASG